MIQIRPSCIQRINITGFTGFHCQIYVKRDDLLHPGLSGNKWRKLKYNLRYAINKGAKKFETLGGPFSNHILAVAFAGKELNIPTVGHIRGRKEYADNPTLAQATRLGMSLVFHSKASYSELKDSFSKWDPNQFNSKSPFLIPEGGSNHLALKGCGEIWNEINDQSGIPVTTVLPVGTGGTLAGLIQSQPHESSLIGISVLKGLDHTEQISLLLSTQNNNNLGKWSIEYGYHFGGFAKHTPRLIEFVQDFFRETGIPLDPIYTGKAMYALVDLIKMNPMITSNRFVFLHTGGLQGIRGYNYMHPARPLLIE